MKTETVTAVKVRTVKELERIQREQAEAARRINEELEAAKEEEAIKKAEKKIFVHLNSIRKNLDEQPEELKKVVSESCSNYTAKLEELRYKLVVECLAAYKKLFQEKKSPEDFQEYLGKICSKKATTASTSPYKPSPFPSFDPADNKGRGNL